MQTVPDGKLRFCVDATNAGHHPAARFFIDYVSHRAIIDPAL